MRILNEILLSSLFFILLTSIGFAQPGIITTYVGPQEPVNGTLAVTQAIDYAFMSVALDGAGGFYVASSTQNKVYRVTADGTLNIVAGNGANGFSGDGGQATSAQLYHPSAVAVDVSGNLFIADSDNNRIRKVTPNGVRDRVPKPNLHWKTKPPDALGGFSFSRLLVHVKQMKGHASMELTRSTFQQSTEWR